MTSDRKIRVSFTLGEKKEPVDVSDYERTDAHIIVEEVSYPSQSLILWWAKLTLLVHAIDEYQRCPHHRLLFTRTSSSKET